MTRPTSHEFTRVALKTNESNAPNLGVFASLNVQAPMPKSAQMAQGLSDVLGVSMPFLEAHAEKKGEEDAARGISDASFGRIEDQRLKRNDQYRQGVESVESKKTIFDARSAWQEHYAEEVDKTLPAGEVAKQYDDFMRERLGEIAKTNPKLAAKMAPEYMHGMQELVVGHQTMLTKAHVADAEATMQAEAADAAMRESPLDFFNLIDDHYKLTGDKHAAYAAGINAVGQQAVSLGRPDLLDAIPTGVGAEGEESKLNDDFTAEDRQRIDQFREAAKAKHYENNKVERAKFKMMQEWQWNDMIRSGTPINDKVFFDYMEEDGLWSEAELTGWREKFYGAQQARKDTLLFGGMNPTKPYYMQIGQLDANGEEITKDRVQGQTNRDVETSLLSLQDTYPDAPKEVLLAKAAVSVTATQAFPYEPLKSTFQYAPLDDAQTFANVANAYAELPVTQRAAYVPDANRRADFEHYLARRDVLGANGSQKAVGEMQQIDPELFEQNVKANAKMLRESDEKIGGEYLQNAAFYEFGKDDVQVSDLKDAGYAQRLISEGTRLRVGHGQPVEQARKNATKDFLSTHMLVRSKSGYRSIARIAGVTEALGEGIDWIEAHLPEIGKQRGVEVPEGSYLRYDFTSRDNAAFVVVDPDGMPLPGLSRFLPQAIERKYRETHPQGDWRKVQETQLQERRRRKNFEEYLKQKQSDMTPLPYSRVHD